jgi:hypothetical protein
VVAVSLSVESLVVQWLVVALMVIASLLFVAVEAVEAMVGTNLL